MESSKKKAKSIYVIALIICAICIIIIPPLLNYILLRPALIPVIKNDTPAALWLSFWGSLLSAGGTFVMAFFAYQAISQENSRQILDFECRNYDILERLIIKNERIHNLEQLKLIANIYLSEGYVSAHKLYIDLLIDVQVVGNEIYRFNDHQDKCYQQYGEILSTLNQRLYILLAALNSRMDWHEDYSPNFDRNEYTDYLKDNNYTFSKGDKENDIRTFIKFAEDFYSANNESPYLQLAKFGQALLQRHYDIIKQTTNNLKQ